MKKILITAALIVGPISLLPFALIARARVSTSTKPRIHLIHDMDNQTRYKAQMENDTFADARAMRQPVAGTVARGELFEDDHYYRGLQGEGFAAGLPSQVTVDRAFLERGQERYEIFCAVCHGYAGGAPGRDGSAQMGPVHERAVQLQAKGAAGISWVQPTAFAVEESLMGANVAQSNVGGDGYLFHVISNGVRNMAGYGSQIPAEDRWAIVAYIRALQVSQGSNPQLGGGR